MIRRKRSPEPRISLHKLLYASRPENAVAASVRTLQQFPSQGIVSVAAMRPANEVSLRRHELISTEPMRISATHRPVQSPGASQPAPKHRYAPTGSPTSQYSVTDQIIGVRVSPAPRSAPVATACMPSNN